MINNMMVMMVVVMMVIIMLFAVVVIIIFVIIMVIFIMAIMVIPFILVVNSINIISLTQIFQFLKQSQKLEVGLGSERNAWLGLSTKSIVRSQLCLAQSNTAVGISQAGLVWFLAVRVASLSILDNDDQKQQSNCSLHYAKDG